MIINLSSSLISSDNLISFSSQYNNNTFALSWMSLEDNKLISFSFQPFCSNTYRKFKKKEKNDFDILFYNYHMSLIFNKYNSIYYIYNDQVDENENIYHTNKLKILETILNEK